MLNVNFSCEIKKDIFGKPEQSAADYDGRHGSVAPEMAASGLGSMVGARLWPRMRYLKNV